MSIHNLKRFIGTYKIKCVKNGGLTLANYGQYSFAQDEEIDLLAKTTHIAIRAGTYHTACMMCNDPALEIASLINAGDLVITENMPPELEFLS